MQNTPCRHLVVLLHSLCSLPNNSESCPCWDTVMHFVSVTLHHMLGSLFDMHCIADDSGAYRVGPVCLNIFPCLCKALYNIMLHLLKNVFLH